jgi:hypothetical protein
MLRKKVPKEEGRKMLRKKVPKEEEGATSRCKAACK